MLPKLQTVDPGVHQVPAVGCHRRKRHDHSRQTWDPQSSRGVLTQVETGAPQHAREATRRLESGESEEAELRTGCAAGNGLPQGGETICVVVGQCSITQLPQEIIDSGTQVIQGTQGGVDRAGDAACIERGQVDFQLCAGERGFGWSDCE